MSDRLHLYLLSADELGRVFGSKDRELVGEILAAMPNRVASLDEWAADYYDGLYDEDDPQEARLTVEQALGEIVDGRLTTGHFNLYLGAWESACSLIGERLPEHWAVRQEWIEPVDAWLKWAGLPVRVAELADSQEPPFPLPENPCIGMTVGHWLAVAIAESRRLLATDWADAPPADGADVLDAIRRWLAAAEKVPDAMIVGFCY